MEKLMLFQYSMISLLAVFFVRDVHNQEVRWAIRFRNLSEYSGIPGAVCDFEYKIFLSGMEHRLMGSVNVTRDLIFRKFIITLHRCSFEKSVCEYFQTWKFSNLKTIFMMKNQMWTPFFHNIQPKFEFPVLKKNIYRLTNATFDAGLVMKFYPEAVKYYFKVIGEMLDDEDRVSFGIFVEVMFFQYVERNRKKNAEH